MIIDVHHHWMPLDVAEHTEKYLRPGQTMRVGKGGDGERIVHIYDSDGAILISISKTRNVLSTHIKDMDRSGVDMALLSFATWQTWTTKENAPVMNNALAKAAEEYPERFLALATVAPTEQGADEELDRAVKDLGMKGVSINTNFRGVYPDEEAYRPLFKKASQLDVPIFVHAAGRPAHVEDLRMNDTSRTLGRQYDHLLAVVRLLYSKYMKEFPNLKFHHGHYGGGFFMFRKRFAEPIPTQAEGLHSGDYNTYLRNFYYDTAPCFWWGVKELEAAVRIGGADAFLFGSDYPLGERTQRAMNMGVDTIMKADISEKEKEKILGGNAARLFHIKN